MAHARRKFFDIVQANNKITKAKEGLAVTALNYIGRLYKIERRLRDLKPLAKKAIRKREATPILKNWIALTRTLATGFGHRQQCGRTLNATNYCGTIQLSLRWK